MKNLFFILAWLFTLLAISFALFMIRGNTSINYVYILIPTVFGAFWLYGKDHVFYFTYEYNAIYYDHFFAEIPETDMQYIKDLVVENDELPDIEPTE